MPPVTLNSHSYTFFIVLYPIGVTVRGVACDPTCDVMQGELIMVYSSLPLLVESGTFSLALPNSWNWCVVWVRRRALIAAGRFTTRTSLWPSRSCTSHVCAAHPAASLTLVAVFPQLYCYMFTQRKKTLNAPAKADK